MPFYFVPDKNQEGFVSLAETEQIAIDNAIEISGTGFFIDDKGTIATNKHVAFPLPTEEEQYRVTEYFGNLKFEMSKQINDLELKKNTLQDLYYKRYFQISESGLVSIHLKLKEYADEITELKNLSSKLNFNKYDIKVVSKSVFLAVGLNDTYVTKRKDLLECVKLIKSQDKDLALMQLKTKKTPADIKPILVQSLKSPINMDDKVYMIGYNSGFSMAQTKEGIKSQLTSGNITQKTDGEKILYSIPTLSGSSGSPIINKYGELIGVNYAKIKDSQGFSYGIPIEHLLTLKNVQSVDGTNAVLITANQEKKDKNAKFKNSSVIKYGIVNASNVNVRSEPHTKNQPLSFQVNLNQKVKILDFIEEADKEFLLERDVEVNISNRTLKLNKGKSITHLSCNDKTNMCKIRFYDGFNYLIGFVPEESITAEVGIWYKIETENGEIGWVYGDFISEI